MRRSTAGRAVPERSVLEAIAPPSSAEARAATTSLGPCVQAAPSSTRKQSGTLRGQPPKGSPGCCARSSGRRGPGCGSTARSSSPRSSMAPPAPPMRAAAPRGTASPLELGRSRIHGERSAPAGHELFARRRAKQGAWSGPPQPSAARTSSEEEAALTSHPQWTAEPCTHRRDSEASTELSREAVTTRPRRLQAAAVPRREKSTKKRGNREKSRFFRVDPGSISPPR